MPGSWETEREAGYIGFKEVRDGVYGHHRLLALKQRGEVAVECVIYEVDDLRAELMEIDENLARSELTAAEEAACIARRKAIYEELHPETQHGGNQSPSGKFFHTGTKSFVDETAAASGKTDRAIRMAAARGRELGSDITRIIGTSLDKGVEMDALIKLPGPERMALNARSSIRINNITDPGIKFSKIQVPRQKYSSLVLVCIFLNYID